MHTKHSETRSQQRCIPNFVIDLLRKFGAKQHDERGGIIRYFDKHSRNQIRSYVGNQLYANVEKHTDAYAVFSLNTNEIITTGHCFKRVLR